MRTMRIVQRTVIGVALLYASAILAAEKTAESPPVSRAGKRLTEWR